MVDLTTETIVVSFVITWVVGMVPPLLIRYTFLKRRMNKWPALGLCILFWFLNMAFFISIGSQSKAHSALLLVAFASYWVLRLMPREHNIRNASECMIASKVKTKEPDYVRCSNCNYEQWAGYEKCQKCGAVLK